MTCPERRPGRRGWALGLVVRRNWATQWSDQSEARKGSTVRGATPSNVGPRE
jgi:hypothetical protein